MHLAWWDQRYKLLKHTWCCGSKCYSSKMSERQVRPPSALWNSEMSTGTTSPANCLKWGSRSPASVDEISSVSPTHRVLAAPATETWNDLKCWAVIFCSSSNIACASSLSSTASVLGAMHVNAWEILEKKEKAKCNVMWVTHAMWCEPWTGHKKSQFSKVALF